MRYDVRFHRRAIKNYLRWVASLLVVPRHWKTKEEFAKWYMAAMIETMRDSENWMRDAKRITKPQHPERWIVDTGVQTRFIVEIRYPSWWQFGKLPELEVVYFDPPKS